MITQPLKRMKFHKSFKYEVTEESHWRESKQVPFSTILSPENCVQLCWFLESLRVLEKWHTKEKNILDPLKLNVPWQEWLDWTLDPLKVMLPKILCLDFCPQNCVRGWVGAAGCDLHHPSPCWTSLDPLILMCLTVLLSLKVLSHARLLEHLGEVFSIFCLPRKSLLYP